MTERICPNCGSPNVGNVPASGVVEGVPQCADCNWDAENGAPNSNGLCSNPFMDAPPSRNIEDDEYESFREGMDEWLKTFGDDGIERREEEH